MRSGSGEGEFDFRAGDGDITLLGDGDVSTLGDGEVSMLGDGYDGVKGDGEIAGGAPPLHSSGHIFSM